LICTFFLFKTQYKALLRTIALCPKCKIFSIAYIPRLRDCCPRLPSIRTFRAIIAKHNRIRALSPAFFNCISNSKRVCFCVFIVFPCLPCHTFLLGNARYRKRLYFFVWQSSHFYIINYKTAGTVIKRCKEYRLNLCCIKYPLLILKQA